MFAILLSEDMQPFYDNVGSFPTVFFSFFLLLCFFYWCVAVLGMVEIDALDFDFDFDLDADGEIDLGPNSDLATADALGLMLFKLGLYGVPLTIIISIMSLMGWFISYYIVHFFFGLVPDGIIRYLVSIGVIVGVLYFTALVTGKLINPLRPLFKKLDQETIKHVVGQTALVRTSKVTEIFGEAELDDGGAGLILKVRSTGGEEFKRGDKVVIFEYNKDENTYRVISEEEFQGL